MDSRLTDILADVFRIRRETVRDDLQLDQLEVWDSLKQMEFILTVERVFQVQLSPQEIFAMRRVDEARRVLRSKGVDA